MKTVRVREIADEIVKATAGLPCALAIRGLMKEYVSQKSQEKRLVILADVYSCLMQNEDDGRQRLTLKGGSRPSWAEPGRDDIAPPLGLANPGHLRQPNIVCSFCELVQEFYPEGRASRWEQTMIEEHLEREHGVKLNHRSISR